METNYDFYFRNCGSLILLLPQTKEAKIFVEEQMCLGEWQNVNSIAIEPRFFSDLVQGITDNQLLIKAI